MRTEVENFDYSRRETKRYPPPGRCIYCGHDDRPLEDEHIVPFALAGDTIIFEKASCRPCAKIINEEFESYCLRTTLGASARARACRLGIRRTARKSAL